MINYKAYKELYQHYNECKHIQLIDRFQEDGTRANKFTLIHDGLFFDFSKNNIDEQTLLLLIRLVHEADLRGKIEGMFRGDKINNTENRAVLHTALRANGAKITVDGHNVCIDIANVFKRMRIFTEKVHGGWHKGYTGKQITDIVNIGIGGSDLGPVLACQALKPYGSKNLRVHFISSVDGYQILDTLSDLNAETTLFVIASKTFTTQETITNADTARRWFLDSAIDEDYIKYHFVAASTNAKAVAAFGIDINNMFEFWDFIGGRYSLFSAIGLSIMLYIGYDNFINMLDGARVMDKHFYETTDFRYNIPVMLALIGIWHINFFDYPSLVISPYSTRLARMPAYIQQLEMESNGKSVNKDGGILPYKTCPAIWGDHGINGQHAYYQLLHQGTTISPMDVIVALSDKFSVANHNDILMANAFAQTEAFMRGKTFTQAKSELLQSGMPEKEAHKLAYHKVFFGNRPSNTIIVPEISPYYLGMLIALYEHKAFTQGVIWDINSFDQMGVELGKQLANTIYKDITGKLISEHDSSTSRLIALYLQNKEQFLRY